MYILGMCLHFFIFSAYSHYLTCIFLHLHVSMPIDVCSIDVLLPKQSCTYLLVSTLHVYSIFRDAVSDYQDTCHASARTDAPATGQLWRAECA
jgi:hypothetical protein